MDEPDTQPQLVKGVLAGLIGGLAGTWAMSHAQRLWTHAFDGDAPDSAAGRHDARDWQERNENKNANELVAQTIGGWMLGRPLTRDELGVAAAVSHYTFGAAAGALYGACIELLPRRRLRSGVGFGTALWITADEVAMPLLGLSEPTTQRPAEMHLQALAAHVVYGVTTELVRRPTRWGM
jgi:putative membrane protein